MAKFYLEGVLGQKCGKIWNLNVKNAKEGIRAIDANTNNCLSEYLASTIKDKKKSYTVIIDGTVLADRCDIVHLEKQISENSEVYFLPTVGGKDPISILTSIFVSVAAQVLANWLFAPPEVNYGSSGDARKDSFLFNGRTAPPTQGAPVPIGYGRMLISGIPVGAEYFYDNIDFGGSEQKFSSAGAYNPIGDEYYY